MGKEELLVATMHDSCFNHFLFIKSNFLFLTAIHLEYVLIAFSSSF